MKKYLALLIMSCVVFTSMSDCCKKLEDDLFPISTVSVELDGKTYKSEARDVPFTRYGPFESQIRRWAVDSVSFDFTTYAWTLKKYEVKFKMKLGIHTAGEIELDKWYPLKNYSGENYVDWTDGDSYDIIDGMMRFTDAEAVENSYIPRYGGEFWFDAVNEKDPGKMLTARNGEFNIQPSVDNQRTDRSDKGEID